MLPESLKALSDELDALGGTVLGSETAPLPDFGGTDYRLERLLGRGKVLARRALCHQGGGSTLARVLDDDERDAVDDERRSDHERAAQMLLHPVVERDAHRGGRHTRNHDLCPHPPRGAALLRRLALGERVELVEEQHAHRKDGPELDNHQKHVPEVRAHIKFYELVEQQHVARGRDGQPLGDALDQSIQGRPQQLI